MATSSATTQRFPCRTQHGQYELQMVVSSSPLPSDVVKRVVIVIHGRERSAATVYSEASAACPAQSSSLIVAPHFYNGLDKGEYQRDSRGTDRLLVWKGNNWGEGGASQYPHGSDLSSFEALDALVAYYGRRDRYPQLEHLVIAGHSMGGQLVQRYSVLGHSSCQVPLSYVVMNASTFVYLNNDEYKYGLKDIEQTLSCYRPALVDVGQLQQRITSRRVHYLQGAADKGIGDDRGEAMKQGQTRQERFRNWQAYLGSNGLSATVSFDMIPHASHDAGQMMASPIGSKYVFLEV